MAVKRIFLGRWNQPFYRFLILGGLNAGFTTTVFVLGAIVLPANIAYTIAFVAGLIVIYFRTDSFVFRVSAPVTAKVSLVFIYSCAFLLAQLVLEVADPTTLLEQVSTALGLAALISPITYFGSKFVILASRQ